MLSFLPAARVINTGTVGYGTDQEYAAFRNWKQFLEPGDTVLILLNESDYFDVLRRRFVGRAKPYVERYHGSFVFRPPSIGPLERWSDWSLLVRVAARVFDRSSSEPASESLESEPIDRNYRFHPEPNPGRNAGRCEGDLGPSRHTQFPWPEIQPFLDGLLPICACLHRSRRRDGRSG